ncbi:glycosyltransferase family 1 protein [Aeromicrobium sp. NPDC092404]|uniref:glycosyltransferase family 1 protein n=1 Tax=Aeromicrobium sp. NPDC092404 TaxID=3154976 RepID=UPI00343CF26A
MPTARPARPGPSSPAAALHRRRIKVASVPAAHPYVRHLAPVQEIQGLPQVVRLPDPDPSNPSRVTLTRWWPPVMLEPAWVREHHERFDLFHLHFGFDDVAPDQLGELVDTLRRAGKPFIHTVHDLRSPRESDRELHDARLDVLVPAADAVVALTPAAAADIADRWGRQAVVLPHPHVVDLAAMARIRHRRQTPLHRDRPFTVGLRVSKPRTGEHPFTLLPALVRAVRAIPGAILQIDAHPDVLGPAGGRFEVDLAREVERSQHRVRVRSREFFSEAQMWDYLGCLDASVLPHRFGPHTSWLEACRDVGTAVVAPTGRHFGDDSPVFGFTIDDGGLDEGSLVDAVRQAYDETPIEPVSVEQRIEQRQMVAAAHARMYVSALADAPFRVG